MADSKRLDWIDAARAIAMLLIYCGHWTPIDSRLAVFAYHYHVAFFFFLSGFFYSKQSNATVVGFSWRSVQRVLIPFYAFGLLNIVYFSLTAPISIEKLGGQVWQLVSTGNLDLAGQLWFLTALFSTQIIHHVVSRVVRLPIIAFVIALITYLVARALPSPPITIYNISGVPYYWVFLAFGDVFFRWYQGKDLNRYEPALYVLSAVFAVMVFAGDRYFFTSWGWPVPKNWSFMVGWDLLMFVALSIATIGLSRILASSAVIRDIGQNTLILVGVETLIKSIALATMGMISFMVKIESPIHVVLYSVLMILSARMIFFRVLNAGAPWMIGKGWGSRKATPAPVAPTAKS